MGKACSIKNKAKIILLTIPIVLFMVFILIMPQKSSNSVKYGLTVCGEIVIPSLFPFAFLSILIYSTNTSKILDKILAPLLKRLGLCGEAGTVFIMSMLGGYPVGSRLIASLRQDGVIDDKTANILLMFCVNPGPAFVMVAVGEGMFRSYKAGIILFTSCTIANFILGILLCLILKPKCREYSRSYIPFSEALIKSISEASASIITICSFVVIFSCICAAIGSFLPKQISSIILSLAEVTNGCLYTRKLGFVFTAFVIAFAGFAVHFQVFSQCRRVKINYKSFYTGRLLHGLITVILTYFLEKIFPITNSVVSFGNIKKSLEISATSVCSLCLICMSFVIMCYWFLICKEMQRKNAR